MKRKLTPAEAATKAKLEAVIAEVGLRELQRRRGPLGLNPLGKPDTVH